MKHSSVRYQPGDIYSFRTEPFTDFSARETNRYAALKILGTNDHGVCHVVLDRIFPGPPSMQQVMNLRWLHNCRSAFERGPACHYVPSAFPVDLDDFQLVGRVELSASDLDLFRACSSYGRWSIASFDAEGEWRWKYDREAYEREVALKHEADRARFLAEQARIENRLKKLTWEKLLEEQPLARWDGQTGQPPAEFVAAARERIRSTIEALKQLGLKPKRRDVRVILKACTEWFNETDAAFGGVIETEEREDIYAALEEMAYVARQRSLIAEIDEWRNW